MRALQQMGRSLVTTLSYVSKSGVKPTPRRALLAATLLVTLFALGLRPLLLPNLTEANLATCIPPPAGLVSWWPGDGHA